MIKKAITNYDLRITNSSPCIPLWRGTWGRKIINLKPQILLLVTVHCLLFTVLTGCAGKLAYERGDSFANEGKWDQAVIAFTEASQKDPENLEYNIRLIMAKERASEYHYQKATDARQRDKLDDAMREFQLAVALNPSNSVADLELKKAIKTKESRSRYELGLELEKQGKFTDAIIELDRKSV